MNLKERFETVLRASRTLVHSDDNRINEILLALADKTVEKTNFILAENYKDISRMQSSDPKYDRLLLTKERIANIASDIRNVAALPSPLGKTIETTTRPNGIELLKISVPFGVIGIIYEARPNVTFDVFSLCLKSGNACILKGSTDAYHSNLAIISIIHEVLDNFNIDKAVATLLPPEREATEALINAVGYVDLIIPRGSQGLINFVRNNSKVPIIETGAGICHTYFHKAGDKEKGAAIINNAKTRRVSVRNALDCLVIDKERVTDLPYLCYKLSESNVIIYADPTSYNALKGYYPEQLLREADEHCFGTEFLDYKMAVKTVGNIYEAIEHITRYSSKHSEAIISEDTAALAIFEKSIDAACVYSNVSTAFTDGAQFGLGAEIGISTQKLHARGPMALEELTTYKWLIHGNGQIRTR